LFEGTLMLGGSVLEAAEAKYNWENKLVETINAVVDMIAPIKISPSLHLSWVLK
jgi:hypothetical protein